MNQTNEPNLKALCGATNQQMNQTSRLCVEPPNLKAATHEPNLKALCQLKTLCGATNIKTLCGGRVLWGKRENIQVVETHTHTQLTTETAVPLNSVDVRVK